MSPPPVEVATVVRASLDEFLEKNRAWVQWPQLKVLRAIARCRTAALGGHLDECPRCGYRTISYCSCRDRHCPQCQSAARQQWLQAREQELLPTSYWHVVFTLPHKLSALVLQNKKEVYALLFRTVAKTLLQVAADRQHLGADIGFLSVLHSWGQTLQFHPHIHCVIPAGGLSPDHTHWLATSLRFFLPLEVLKRVFRGKFVAGLKRLFRRHRLILAGKLQFLDNQRAFLAFLRTLHEKDWVVYAKPPFGGPRHVLRYLARYTHRVAISNNRLVSFQDGRVTFRWRDYAHGNKKRLMVLSAEEFLRRFLLHVFPRGFVRIRFFGFLANSQRAALLPLCNQLIQADPRRIANVPARASSAHPTCFCCPSCQTPMRLLERFTATRLSRWPVMVAPRCDSS